MPRWEPGTRERLERAALELFAIRGYDSVTVQDIADRAGLGKATFFRLFNDKREVLFWGQDLLVTLFADGIAASGAEASTVARLHAALQAVAAAFPDNRHELAATREAVVAAHPDLQERLAFKRTVMRDTLHGALLQQGVPEGEAAVGAELGRAAFSAAYRRWAESAAPTDFAALAHDELERLVIAAEHLRR